MREMQWKRRVGAACVAAGCVVALGCGPEEAPAGAGGGAPGVRHHGEIRQIFAGNWAPIVELDEVVQGPSTYALGALGDLRGEFLVVGGQTWLAYPTTDARPRVETSEGTTERAVLAVAAEVDDWVDVELTQDVPGGAVEEHVRALAEASGVDVAEPFPFLIRGRLRNVAWHVVDGTRVEPGMAPNENAQHGVEAEAEATLVGFHSFDHQGVFTMMGTHVHMHAVLADGAIMGHVGQVELPRGTIVSFPRGAW